MWLTRLQANKKWYYVLATLALILCIAGSLLWREHQRTAQPAASKIPLVRTAAVGTVGISPTFTYAGEVRGRYESQLAFRVGGKIVKRYVDLGAAVQPGDVLMQLDPQDLTQTANSYAAQLAAAQAQLQLAESNLTRYRQLFAQAAVSQAQLDQYQNAYDLAQAAVRQAAAQYEQGSNQLNYTQLLAGQPGVVAAINAETGQVVSAGQTVLTIVRDGEREVEISVPENRLEELRQAKLCRVTFWALPGVAVDGSIREIAPMASAITRTYTIRIALVKPPPAVKLGMTASVQVTTAMQPTAVAAIPASAVYQAGPSPAVWVVKDRVVSLRPVTVGTMTNDTIEVLTGLEPGETIITAGVHKLQAGQMVNPVGGELP